MARRIEGIDPLSGEVIVLSVREGRVHDVVRRGPTGENVLPYAIPGLVDLQVNGYGGIDVNAASVEPADITRLTRELAAAGTTTWVPTIITAPEKQILETLAVVARAREVDDEVRRAIPFVHVEGPFLSAVDGPRGAHPIEHVRPIDADEVERWSRSGVLGYVTVSPHWEESARHVAAIRSLGVTVALGHTDAEPERIRAAVDAGATLSTHLGNGINALLPRHPNLIWTQLADLRLTCGFIADGHHLPADALRAMVSAKGLDRSFVVSDSVALAGCDPGHYVQPIGGSVELDASGRLSSTESGLLAGSAATLADCLRFLTSDGGFPLRDAVQLLCINPGRLVAEIGRDRPASAGRLVQGAAADVVLIDRNGFIVEVFRAGIPAYSGG